MGAKSRTKGQCGEREFSALLRDELGVTLRRNLQQTQDGGHDLIVDGPLLLASAELDRYAIEVKRYAQASRADIAKWWQQTARQAERVGRVPCLAYRVDRQDWRVVVPLDRVLLGEHTPQSFTVEMDAKAFCYCVREGV